MAAGHPDIIKIWVDDFFGATEPKMPPEIYGAVIDEDHKHGLRVAAHIFHLEDAKSLLPGRTRCYCTQRARQAGRSGIHRSDEKEPGRLHCHPDAG